jgi:hypothetical protein
MSEILLILFLIRIIRSIDQLFSEISQIISQCKESSFEHFQVHSSHSYLLLPFTSHDYLLQSHSLYYDRSYAHFIHYFSCIEYLIRYNSLNY